MYCKRIIIVDGTVMENVYVKDSPRFKDCLEIESENGEVIVIKREDMDTLVEDTEKDNWAVQV